MNNINSFSESVNKLIQNVNVGIESLVQINKSLSAQEDTVNITYTGNDPITGDSSTYTYAIPSYNFITNKINTFENTLDVFISGNGVILLNDGTYREVKTIPIAISPSKIENVASPTTFTTRSNWFFESMMFPQIIVQFNLKNKIDDNSDRITVKRVIFDNFDDVETQWFKDNLNGQSLTYYEVVSILNRNQKKYWEDEDVITLPLSINQYSGEFYIKSKQYIDGKVWYTLDTINYGLTSDYSVVKNIQLNKGDKLRYGENSIYSIDEIVATENRVTLTSLIGLSTPTISKYFYVYTDPFKDKIANIAIGYDECNCIFIKGINDYYNLNGDEWSKSISFYTNDLIQENTSNISLVSYYSTYVSDFGRQLEGQARERYIPAFYGITPNAPTLTVDQFTVKQVNTQLNAALDKTSVLDLQANIISNKSLISELQGTIASQKSNLIELTSTSERESLQKQINSNINTLSNLVIQYQTDVKTLATIAYENNAVIVNPKYRAQAFFEIPTGVYPNNDPSTQIQEIVQFDISYRYLRLDGTGNPLNTYSYTDPVSGQIITGTKTDWEIIQSAVRQRKWNNITGVYEWAEENIQDGQTVNINQVDIAIQKGEKVEIKIRSISEAGWPLNPLKSDWSNTVVVEFPANLTGSDQLTTILTGAQSEETAIQLQQTLDSAGVTSHLSDVIPNPNAAQGVYYNHQSKNIAYDQATKQVSDGAVTAVNTVNVQYILENLADVTYVTIANPSGGSSKTITLQYLLQKIVNQTPAIYTSL